MTSTPPEVSRWLEKDHDDARDAIDKFDGQLFTIRNWAISGGGALLALGLSQNNAEVLWLGILPILIFGYLELTYKCFHEDALARSQYVEGVIADLVAGKTIDPQYRFGLGQAFETPSVGKMMRTLARRRHIARFYVGIVLALAISAVVTAATDGSPSERKSVENHKESLRGQP